jgi:hypothetical protein
LKEKLTVKRKISEIDGTYSRYITGVLTQLLPSTCLLGKTTLDKLTILEMRGMRSLGGQARRA